jgi:hypothetical protein
MASVLRVPLQIEHRLKGHDPSICWGFAHILVGVQVALQVLSAILLVASCPEVYVSEFTAVSESTASRSREGLSSSPMEASLVAMLPADPMVSAGSVFRGCTRPPKKASSIRSYAAFKDPATTNATQK